MRRRPVRAEIVVRRDVGEPADVGDGPFAGQVDRPEGLPVERPVEVELELGGRPDPHPAVAARRIVVEVRRAEPRRRSRSGPAGASSLPIATAAKTSPLAAAKSVAISTPRKTRRRRISAEPSRRRAIPNPVNRHVPMRASTHG